MSESEIQATERTFWTYVLPIYSTEIIKRDPKRVRSYRRVMPRQFMLLLGMVPTNNVKTVYCTSLITSYREQPRSTRIVVVCLWLAVSGTKRTDHSPISFEK